VDTDFLLIRRMKRGDEAAFDIFVHKYYESILTYCCYHCPDTSYAEDLTQEVFVRFFEKLSNYHYMGKTLNYMYTIAGNLCRDYYKKARDDLWDGASNEIGDMSDILELDGILDKITIEDALKKLPDELQEVIIFHYFRDLKLSEIAELLQVGLPLVKYRIQRARLLLKNLLKED